MKLGPPKLKGHLGKTHRLDQPVTLREFLSDVDSYVAISASSAFVYIGPAQEFLTSDHRYVDFWYRRQKLRAYIHALDNWKAGKGQSKPVYKEHEPFLDRMVSDYYSRQLPDEHPMWIIPIEGDELGELWLESEAGPWLKEARKAIIKGA